jgi:quercetin dioxygenase-like cupin family protein
VAESFATSFPGELKEIPHMDEQQWTKQLTDEGFEDVYVWEDGPNVSYPEHRHPDVSAHVILEGEMTVTVDGHTRTYKPGERFDVPGKTGHTASMGPEGCKYLVGER